MTQLPNTWLDQFPVALEEEYSHFDQALNRMGSRPPDIAHPALGMYGEVHPWYDKKRQVLEELVGRAQDPMESQRYNTALRLHQIDTAEAYGRLKPFRRSFQTSGLTPEEYANKVEYHRVIDSPTSYFFDWAPVRAIRGAELGVMDTLAGFFPSVREYLGTKELKESHEKAAAHARKKGALGERATRIGEQAMQSILEFSAFLGAGAGPYGAIGLQAMGQARDTLDAAEAVGLDARTGAVAAVAAGVIEGGITGWLQKSGYGGLEDVMDGFFKGVGGRPGVRGIIANMAMEGSEEATIEFAQSLVNQISEIDPQAMEPKKLINSMIDAAASGALAAGSMTGVQDVMMRAQGYQPLNKPGESPEVPKELPVEETPSEAFEEGKKWALENRDKALGLIKTGEAPSRNQFESATGQTKTTKEYRSDYREGAVSVVEERVEEPDGEPEMRPPEYDFAREKAADKGTSEDWGQPFTRMEAEDILIDKMNFSAIKPIPTPELNELVQALGFTVEKKKLGGALGKISPNQKKILLDPQSARDHRLLAKVVAHELGHLIDYLPNETFKRGNLLGRISSMWKYREQFLARLPSSPGTRFPAGELRRLRRLAEKENTTEYTEEVQEEIKIRTEVTPQDILNIWNSLDEENMNTDLRQYIKTLSDTDKHSIVLEAFKDNVPEDLQQFAKEITETITKQVTRKKKGPLKKLNKIYQNLILKEIEARKLFKDSYIRDELNDLSMWWNPYDPKTVTPSYVAYRRSGVELYADAMSVLLNSPGELERRAPSFWRGWLNYLEKKPEVAQAFAEVQELLNGSPLWLAERVAKRYQNMYKRGNEAFMAHLEQKRLARQSIISALTENWFVFTPMHNLRNAAQKIAETRTDFMNKIVHRGWGLLHLQEKARKRGAKISDELDGRFWMEQLFRVHGASRAFVDRVNNFVWAPMHEYGIDESDFGMYLNMRRIINERFRVLNPFLETKESAEEGIDGIRLRIGEEKFKRMQELAQKFYDLEFEVTKHAYENGLYSKKDWENTILPNSDAYVTNLPIKYVTDNLDASLRKVIGSVDETVHPLQSSMLKMAAVMQAAEINRHKTSAMKGLVQMDPGKAMWKELRPKEKPALMKEELTVRVDGKPVKYEVPPEYGIVFNARTGGDGPLKRLMNTATYGTFYRLYITWNPAFALRNPSRDIMGSYLRLGPAMQKLRKKKARKLAKEQGIKYSEALDRIKGPPTYKEFLLAYKDEFFNKETYRKVVGGKYDPLDNKLLATGALDVPFTTQERHRDIGISDESAAKILEEVGVFPTPEQLKKTQERFQKAVDAIDKHLPEIVQGKLGAVKFLNPQWIIDMQERAGKMAGHKFLKEMNLTDAEMAYMMNNFVGTPNTRYRGTASDGMNAAFMFFSIRMANLRAQASAAKMDPVEYMKRAGINVLVSRTLRRVALYGGFGETMRQFFELIGEDEDELIIPIPMITSDPEDKLDKAMYFRIPQDETIKFWGGLHDLVWDGLEQLAKDGDVEAKNALKETVELTQNMTLGTLAPPWDMTRAWHQYGMGRIPYDDYFNTPIFPEQMAMARGEEGNYDAMRKMVAWTFMKFGAVEKFASPLLHSDLPLAGVGASLEPRPAETSLEQWLRAPPGLNAIFRISNRGVSSGMWEDKRAKDSHSAHISSYLRQDRTINQMARNYSAYRGFNYDELEEEDRYKKARLMGWGKLWSAARDHVDQALADGLPEEAARVRRNLSADTEIIREIWAAADRGDIKEMERYQALFESRLQ